MIDINSLIDEKRRDKKEKHKKLQWVMPNLIWRVVSQKCHDGKLYNTKVQVQDVNYHEDLNGKHALNISVLLNKHLYEGIREKDLETVMPSLNENVRIVKGEYRGITAQLLERDKKSNKVRLMLNSNFDIVELTQDDWCKFT